MYFSVIDSLGQTLGGSHSTIEQAADAIEELGEAAGEMSVIEVSSALEDSEDASQLTGQRWEYNSLKESLIKL